MGSTSWLFATRTIPNPAAGELIRAPRARLAVEQDERAKQRRRELLEQRSDLNPPHVRIRVWEQLHGLRLPSDSTHPILDVIAVATRLTLEQVREEQHARLSRKVAQPGP